MKRGLLGLVVLTVAFGAWAQTAGGIVGADNTPAPAETTLKLSPLWLQMAPAVSIPVGDSTNYFGIGGDGSFIGEYRFPFQPHLLARATLEYNYSPIAARQTVSLTSFDVGAGYSYNFTPTFGAEAFAGGGVTYGFFNNSLQTGSLSGYANPFVKAGLELHLDFPPRLQLGLGASFLYQIGLYTGVGVFLGAAYGVGTPVTVQKFAAPRPQQPTNRPQLLLKPGTGIQFANVDLHDIYPVFYKYYDDHPIGTAVLHNFEKGPVKNVKVSVFVKEYMTDPKIVDGPTTLDPGKDADIDLYGLFTKDILANTESNKVSARLSVTGVLNGKEVQYDNIQTLDVLKRNSLTWDDDRKAAAFVSANDPTAVKFAKNIQSMIQPAVNKSIDPSLELAMAVHEGLTLYGLTYSSDPVATLNSDNKTVDYIQFPSQTLDYKGGKCSDFSVLYSSMLEAIGVETAFITIPGHIYMAVALKMDPETARRTFVNPDDLIYQDNKVWLPIEITLREGGFIKAWQLAAREWRENQAKGTAKFYPVHDAWKTYQPVGYSSSELNIKIPDQNNVLKAFQDQQVAFVDMQIGPQEASLLAEAKRPGDPSRPLNTLAVLYSRYGEFDKAQKVLGQILAKEQYLPALVNMGNIFFVRGDIEGALKYYNTAYQKSPNSPTVLLCIAQANHAEENYASAKDAYDKLQKISPDLAQKYAYLNLKGQEATRAADAAGLNGTVVWQETDQ